LPERASSPSPRISIASSSPLIAVFTRPRGIFRASGTSPIFARHPSVVPLSSALKSAGKCSKRRSRSFTLPARACARGGFRLRRSLRDRQPRDFKTGASRQEIFSAGRDRRSRPREASGRQEGVRGGLDSFGAALVVSGLGTSPRSDSVPAHPCLADRAPPSKCRGGPRGRPPFGLQSPVQGERHGQRRREIRLPRDRH
jgi:hypothetical protein